MNRLLGAARYLALTGVLFGVLASAIAFAWGGLKVAALAVRLVRGDLDGIAVHLVQVMDALLIASALLIFAIGLYELFIGPLDMPVWLKIDDLDALKRRLAGVVVLVMAVSFIERLETNTDAREILYVGVAVALVSAALSLLRRH